MNLERGTNGRRERVRQLVALAIAVLANVCVPTASAESQSEALERLDNILENLVAVRETTRSMGTLDEALSNSVFRYTCARMWVLGALSGGLSGDVTAGVKGELAFRLPTPFGMIQTYGWDNGAPVSLGAGLKGAATGLLDVAGSFENWNCWSEDLPFARLNPYEIEHYESPYNDWMQTEVPGAEQRVASGEADEGTGFAVDVINALVTTIRDLGLDPSSSEVVSKILTDGALSALDEFGALATPSQNMAERALGAPASLVQLVSEKAPGLGGANNAFVSTVNKTFNSQYDDLVESINPCEMLPFMSQVCNEVRSRGEQLLRVAEILETHDAITGLSGGSSFMDAVDTIAGIAFDARSMISDLSYRFAPVMTAADELKQFVVSILNNYAGHAAPLYNEVSAMVDDLFESVGEWDQTRDAVREAYNRTYTISNQFYGDYHSAAYTNYQLKWVSCIVSLTVQASSGTVEPDMVCQW